MPSAVGAKYLKIRPYKNRSFDSYGYSLCTLLASEQSVCTEAIPTVN